MNGGGGMGGGGGFGGGRGGGMGGESRWGKVFSIIRDELRTNFCQNCPSDLTENQCNPNFSGFWLISDFVAVKIFLDQSTSAIKIFWGIGG